MKLFESSKHNESNEGAERSKTSNRKLIKRVGATVIGLLSLAGVSLGTAAYMADTGPVEHAEKTFYFGANCPSNSTLEITGIKKEEDKPNIGRALSREASEAKDASDYNISHDINQAPRIRITCRNDDPVDGYHIELQGKSWDYKRPEFMSPSVVLLNGGVSIGNNSDTHDNLDAVMYTYLGAGSSNLTVSGLSSRPSPVEWFTSDYKQTVEISDSDKSTAKITFHNVRKITNIKLDADK